MEDNTQENAPEIDKQSDHVMPVDQATKEVDSWIEYKKISEKRQSTFAGSRKTMIEGFCLGKLVLNQETKVIKQKLDFPVGKNNAVVELSYQPRLSLGKINQSLKGVDPTDADARVVAHIAALTNQVNAVINELDSEDAVLAEAIAVFFL